MPHLFAIDLVKEKINKLAPENRVEFINDIMEGYCRRCGGIEIRERSCQCCNDE